MTVFNIANWYWYVGTDRSRAWSSAKARFVDTGDPDLQSFINGGAGVQEINSLAELAQIFAQNFAEGMLDVYAAACRFRKETGGIVINGAMIATDRESQAMINGAFNYVSVNPDKVISYKAGNKFVSLTSDEVKAVAGAVGGHVQACFDKEAFVLAQIAAGAISSVQDIDAAFAAI